VKPLIDLSVPLITFILLTVVGSSLTPDDFSRVRRQPGVVLAGLLAPLALLPPLAIALVTLFQPAPEIEAGLILIAACPIGGISNTYSYLARASTALSVTLTGLSSLCAVVTIPLLDSFFERVLHRPFGFQAPAFMLVGQLLLMLALPIGLGMWLRHGRPRFADDHGPLLQRVSFVTMGALLSMVIVDEQDRFVGGLSRTVPLAAAFILASLAAGWIVALIVRAGDRDRFTLAAEFATRNVAVATAIAVTLMGRFEFALFATTYFLTELPIMLAMIAWHRRRSG
jgi:BASS family bile acid:Na+ symporter